jgi:hypothetical protein
MLAILGDLLCRLAKRMNNRTMYMGCRLSFRSNDIRIISALRLAKRVMNEGR